MGRPCHLQAEYRAAWGTERMNIQTLLGLTENYQADLVDLMLSDKTDGKIKRIFLLGFIKDCEIKLSKLEPKRKGPKGKGSAVSVDEERAELINSLQDLLSARSMTILSWIDIAQQIEDVLEAEGRKQDRSFLPNGKRYFPHSVSDKRLENSVCAGWKKLDT